METTPLQQLVSGYLQCAPEDIHPETSLGRDVFKSSILLNRMFAQITTLGIKIDDYSAVKTVGDLMALNPGQQSLSVGSTLTPTPSKNGSVTTAIGIDIESSLNLPDASDYREHDFYIQNFSSREIAHCILKPNPKESFAGLFAAKESLVKADAALRSRNFASIEITHDDHGKPGYPGFSLSISHADHLAVAVAVDNLRGDPKPIEMLPVSNQPVLSGKMRLLFWLFVLLTVINTIILFLHWH